VTGYLHPEYAASFEEFGMPRYLPRSRGWILERNIPNSTYRDAMGCYPLFACQDWSALPADFEEIGTEFVSLTLVTDPFGNYDLSLLEDAFEKVIPFKEHFIADLSRPASDATTSHHRYYARRALRQLSVAQEANPAGLLDTWIALYATLARKRNVTGLRTFSRTGFAKQLSIPWIVVFRAVFEDQIIGMHLWYVQNGVAYSHLEAVNETGYELGAAYALYWSALEFFRGSVGWVDLGAGAGTKKNAQDGLSYFKKGWATGSRPVYLCGRVFNRERYDELVNAKDAARIDYFPAYRRGEFG
jgi:hypothetical protein